MSYFLKQHLIYTPYKFIYRYVTVHVLVKKKPENIKSIIYNM